MSTSPSLACFAEQNDFALLLARGTPAGRGVRIDALAEIPLSNAAALAEAARATVPAGATLTGAVRPTARGLHLASPAEAAAHAGLAGAQKFSAGLADFAKDGAPWLAVSRARDGAAPDGTPWLASFATAASRQQATAALDSLGLKPSRSVSATHHAIGAAGRLSGAPTLLLEIGELTTHAILLSPAGVLAVAPVSLNLDRISEAVQLELGMKFRGSATKLLFNADYDFSDAAPKIAARLAAVLKPELAALRGATPTVLACAGLPAAQHWLANSLATALDLTPFAPDLKAWCASAGVTFASADLEATVSPAWVGFLHLIGSGTNESAPWTAPWNSASSAPAAAPAPAAAAKSPPPTPPSAPTPAPAPEAKTPPPAPPAPKPAAPAPAPAAAPAAAKNAPASSPAIISVKTVAAPAPKIPAPAPVEKPTAPVPAAKAAAPAQAKPVAVAAAAPAVPAAQAANESSVSYPPKNAPAAKGQAKRAPEPAQPKSMIAAAAAKAAGQPPSNKAPAPKSPAPAPAPVPAAAVKPGSKRTLVVFAVAAVVLIGAVIGGLAWKANADEQARLAAENARVEAARLAEVERQRKLEEQARIEAETRRRIEVETAQRVAAAEAARKQAENEARIQAEQRLAAARGTLIVQAPAGATVTVGELPAATGPTTIGDLKLGRYPVTVSLPNHEPLKLELEVKENETTDSGPIKLQRVVGTLILTSEPADANFEVRPAGAAADSPAARRGRTPATFEDVAPGDYVVTFTRDGWQPHTETITIGRDSTVRAACAFRTGIVKLSTTPAGAAVSVAGQNVGVTPLTLVEQNPGTVTFEINLAGHDPETVEATIQPGQVLTIERSLESEDRLVRLSETDERPVAILSPQPEISSVRIDSPTRVEISLTVDRDGNPRDIQLIKAPTPVLGKLCVEAAAKWKFKPATVNGKPVNVRVAVPFTILPAQ